MELPSPNSRISPISLYNPVEQSSGPGVDQRKMAKRYASGRLTLATAIEARVAMDADVDQ
jgi:hypothetical protein